MSNERIEKEAFLKKLSNEGNNVFHCSVTKTMSDEVFAEFLSLFEEIGSDVNQRIANSLFLFHCALPTGEQSLAKVLQWLERRFASEQLIVVQMFSSELYASNDRFHLANLPANLPSVQASLTSHSTICNNPAESCVRSSATEFSCFSVWNIIPILNERQRFRHLSVN